MLRFVLLWFFICIAYHCYVMSLLCLCAFVTLNKRLLTYLLTYLLTPLVKYFVTYYSHASHADKQVLFLRAPACVYDRVSL